MGHESYLRRMEVATQQLVASANFSNKRNALHRGQQPKGFNWSNGSSKQQTSNHNSLGPNSNQRCFTQQSGKPNSNQPRFQPKCQFCDQLGHTAKVYPQLQQNEVTVNCASSSHANENKWLIDSAASHNITGDFTNLSIHS